MFLMHTDVHCTSNSFVQYNVIDWRMHYVRFHQPEKEAEVVLQ